MTLKIAESPSLLQPYLDFLSASHDHVLLIRSGHRFSLSDKNITHAAHEIADGHRSLSGTISCMTQESFSAYHSDRQVFKFRKQQCKSSSRKISL